jgi:hypothetical protein
MNGLCALSVELACLQCVNGLCAGEGGIVDVLR